MDSGGWLDQILGVLTHPWLTFGVALLGGGVVAYLARRSPKRDWTFIQEGAGALLLGAFFVSSFLRSVPRLVVPELTFVCDRATGPFGLEEASNCRTESVGEAHTVVTYTFADLGRDYFVLPILEGLIALVGAGVAILIARYTLHRVNG
jgi:hypothetical protein